MRHVVLVALLVLTPVAAGWDQLHGGPHRSGQAQLSAIPFDVVATIPGLLPSSGARFMDAVTHGLAATPDHGLIGVVFAPGEEMRCQFVRIEDPFRPDIVRSPIAGSAPACTAPPAGMSAGLQAFDRRNNLVYTCLTAPADGAVLMAHSAGTLSPRWYVAPSLALNASSPPPATPGLVERWSCSGAAVDATRNELLVAFTAYRLDSEGRPHQPIQNRIAAIPLPGPAAPNSYEPSLAAVRWSREIPVSAFVNGPTPVGLPRAGAIFAPHALTTVPAGVVATGVLHCDPFLTGDACEGTGVGSRQLAVAWLTANGEIRGTRMARAGPPGDGAIHVGSWWGAASGAAGGTRVVHALGPNVIRVDPLAAQPEVADLSIDRLDHPDRNWAAPAWSGRTVLVPVEQRIVAYDSDGDLRDYRVWDPPLVQAVVLDLIATDTGTAYALVAAEGPEGPSMSLLRFDVATLETTQKIELRALAGRNLARLIVLGDDRLAVAGADGTLVLLALADPALVPRAELSVVYPTLEERVELLLDLAGRPSVERLTVAWGDGALDEYERICVTAPGTSSCDVVWDNLGTPQLDAVQAPGHAYARRQEGAAVRVTALYADGRTATAVLPVHPGVTPPPPPPGLNFMQQFFADPDRAWGIIGLVPVALGAVYAISRRHRRQSRLESELEALERIRDQSLRSPLEALRSLELYRQRVHDEVARRRLDDSQLAVLEARMGRMFRGLSRRLLAPFRIRTSLGYQSLLEAALEDGLVNVAEAAELKERLRDEKHLSRKERDEIRALIDAWTWRNARLQPPTRES